MYWYQILAVFVAATWVGFLVAAQTTDRHSLTGVAALVAAAFTSLIFTLTLTAFLGVRW
jgi:hypothetical protein